jgi:LytS/YehU family sensor histidine kinase
MIVKAYNWYKVSPINLILRVIVACVVMSAIFTIFSFGFDMLLVHPDMQVSAYFFFLNFTNATVLFVLWSLIYFSIHFFRDYRKREIEHLKWENAIKDFELNKLKSQLNPHFVFNALNSIRALIDEDPTKAKQATTQLSNILRNSLLADRSKTVSLQEEMKTVNDYLNLEKIRYEERLNVNIDIEPEVQLTQVPPMMIQTIVENAVKHGISKEVGKGFIKVIAKQLNDFMEVNIKNSGRLGNMSSPTGFGLINTRQRLELIYGTSEGFSITQEDDNTVNVTLLIPIR